LCEELCVKANDSSVDNGERLARNQGLLSRFSYMFMLFCSEFILSQK